MRPTLELVPTEYQRPLERKPDAESGHALIRVMGSTHEQPAVGELIDVLAPDAAVRSPTIRF